MKAIKSFVFAALLFAASLFAAPAPAQMLLLGVGSTAASGGASTPATFIAATTLHITSATTFDAALPTTGTGGAVADGDLLLVWYPNGFGAGDNLVAKSSSVAFTKVDYDYNPVAHYYSVWARVLTSAERANGFITITGGDTGSQINMAFVRGASAAVFKSHYQWSSSSQAITGFSPPGSFAGAVFLVINNDEPAATVSATGWVMNASLNVWGSRGYLLSNFTYTGSSDTFSGFNGTQEKAGILIGLTP